MEDLQSVLDTYLLDRTFVIGFVAGIAATLAFAFLMGKAVALWNRLLQPFKPIQKPGRLPTETAPSPATQFMSWLGSVLMLILFLAIVGLLLWQVLGGSSG